MFWIGFFLDPTLGAKGYTLSMLTTREGRFMSMLSVLVFWVWVRDAFMLKGVPTNFL